MSADIQAGERLALALAGSLILHFALMFGIEIRPPADTPARPRIIQARLVETAPAPAPAPRPEPPPEPDTLQLRTEQTLSEPPPPPPPQAPEPETTSGAAAPDASGTLPAVTVPLIEDPKYYPATEVDIHPMALQAIMPNYPPQAAKASVSGSVILLLLLDEGGNVQEISVEQADPPGYFEESALAAFRHARFAPAERHGKVVKSRIRIKVTYELGDKPVKSGEAAPAAPAVR